MGSLHSGWDCFFSEPGEYDKMYCHVCNEEMEIKRDVMGATGWAEAISVHHGSKGHLHDSFWCKCANENWHNQARILKNRIQKESSQTVAKMLEEEVEKILTTRKITKEGSWEYL